MLRQGDRSLMVAALVATASAILCIGALAAWVWRPGQGCSVHCTSPIALVLLLALSVAAAVALADAGGVTRWPTRIVGLVVAAIALVTITGTAPGRALSAWPSGLVDRPDRTATASQAVAVLFVAVGVVTLFGRTARGERRSLAVGAATIMLGCAALTRRAVHLTATERPPDPLGKPGAAITIMLGAAIIIAMSASARRLLTATHPTRTGHTVLTMLPVVVLLPLSVVLMYALGGPGRYELTLPLWVGAITLFLVHQVWAVATDVGRAERRRFDLIESLSDGIVSVRGNRVIYASDVTLRMLGIAPGPDLPLPVEAFFGTRLTEVVDIVRRLQDVDPGTETLVDVTLADGDPPRVLMVSGRPAFALADTWIVVVRDVTERVLAKRELKAAAAALEQRITEQEMRLLRYGAVVEATGDAIVTETLDGAITGWNPAAERLYGYTEAEVIGRDLSLIVPEDRRDELRDMLRRVGEGETVRRVDTVRMNRLGGRVEVALTAFPLPEADGAIVGASVVAHDLTAERLEKERFRAVFEAAGAGLLIVGHDGLIGMANREAERLFGYRTGGLIGQAAEDLVPESLRDGHAGHRASYFDRPEARPIGDGRRVRARRRDGTEFPAVVGLNPIGREGRSAVVVSVVDVTILQHAEKVLERKNADLRRSNRELEEFAYAASHDLQEPLRMVVSYTQLLAQRYDGRLDERADTYIRFAVDGGRRMQRLVKDLLAYSRVGTRSLRHRPVNLGKVVRAVVDDLQSLLRGSDAKVVVGDLPAVTADESGLSQVFLNLLTNAIKFHADRPPVIRIDGRIDGDDVVFTVADNGIGIPAAQLADVFVMFRRLHDRERYAGSGIGLAMVRRVVERHGGQVTCESTVGEGTTFSVRLPRVPVDDEPGGLSVPPPRGDAAVRPAAEERHASAAG
ncbi:sensor histidine kinase [Mangrovihabitans endophyticus]|uniref:histidine kinase n=1 Tax=Mangrovihabitans endophyticus TaxID=1751298 RepID=A0A8J3C1M5_9ACTN|nr:PAS domain S-box protein [Mangrovihabitans endophyticus]GGK94201.1 hypothetical protein GCM10012284_30360 [Mangrovihabitans endophyticus]